jgi:hypothetical protein
MVVAAAVAARDRALILFRSEADRRSASIGPRGRDPTCYRRAASVQCANRALSRGWS